MIKPGKYLANLIAAVLILQLCLSCSNKPKTKFERAEKFVKSQCTEKFFKEKDPTFISIQGTHNPTDWLNYFFSVMSTRNWITEEDEYAEYVLGPVLPKNIKLQPKKHNPQIKSAQLVIIADDSQNKIFVEGYDSAGTVSVYNSEWDFPELD